MNIVNSLKGSWFGERQKYPVIYKEDYGKWETVCHEQGDIINAIIREYPEIITGKMSFRTLHKCLIQKFDQLLLFDSEANNFIRRFDYCQKFHTQPFSGSYDDLPAIWIDFCELFNEIVSDNGAKS